MFPDYFNLVQDYFNTPPVCSHQSVLIMWVCNNSVAFSYRAMSVLVHIMWSCKNTYRQWGSYANQGNYYVTLCARIYVIRNHFVALYRAILLHFGLCVKYVNKQIKYYVHFHTIVDKHIYGIIIQTLMSTCISTPATVPGHQVHSVWGGVRLAPLKTYVETSICMEKALIAFAYPHSCNMSTCDHMWTPVIAFMKMYGAYVSLYQVLLVAVW